MNFVLGFIVGGMFCGSLGVVAFAALVAARDVDDELRELGIGADARPETYTRLVK